MVASAVAPPSILHDAGYLFIAPLLTALQTNTVAGSIFTDSWPAAWLPLGATAEGSEFKYSTEIEPIVVAEFFDPIRYATTARAGSIAFNLASLTLTNYRRALNGGTAARMGRRYLVAPAAVTLIDLPSSSPAHARPVAEKAAAWAALQPVLFN